MVEAIARKGMFQTLREFNTDGGNTNNSTMDSSTHRSAHNEDDDPIVNDVIASVTQSEAPRASAGTVAFYAYLSGSKCYHDYETIVFDTEVTDISGSYNVHDGIFDVPVTGTYIISVQLGANEYRWVSVQIVSNSNILGVTLADSEDVSSHPSGSMTIAVHLQAGDHVFVRRRTANGSCAIYSSNLLFTSFSAWLLA